MQEADAIVNRRSRDVVVCLESGGLDETNGRESRIGSLISQIDNVITSIKQKIKEKEERMGMLQSRRNESSKVISNTIFDATYLQLPLLSAESC